MRPHRRQPTRLSRPWDSLGKNTGVGCHFLLQCMKVKSKSEVAQSCLTLWDPMDWSLPGSSVHRIFQARGLEWVAIAFSSGSRYMTRKQRGVCDNIIQIRYKEGGDKNDVGVEEGRQLISSGELSTVSFLVTWIFLLPLPGVDNYLHWTIYPSSFLLIIFVSLIWNSKVTCHAFCTGFINLHYFLSL